MVKQLIRFSPALGLLLANATSVLAQTATGGASKGGTGGALPAAGTTEITYFFFIGGLILFVVGMMKLVTSFRS